MNYPTATLTEVTNDMKNQFGPPARAGWLAAKKDGKFFMCAGKAAAGIFFSNALAQNAEIFRIVKDPA